MSSVAAQSQTAREIARETACIMEDDVDKDAGVVVVGVEEGDGEDVVCVEEGAEVTGDGKKSGGGGGGDGGGGGIVVGKEAGKVGGNDGKERSGRRKGGEAGGDAMVGRSGGGKKRGGSGWKGSKVGRVEEAEGGEKRPRRMMAEEEEAGGAGVAGKAVEVVCNSGVARKSGGAVDEVEGTEDGAEEVVAKSDLQAKEVSDMMEKMKTAKDSLLEEMISKLSAMRGKREIEVVEREHFEDELNYDVGSYTLCDERDPSYATTEKVDKHWKVYQKIGTTLKGYLTEVVFQKYNKESLKKKPQMEMKDNVKGFMDSIAQVYVARDDPDEVRKLCGQVYRWRLDFSVPLSKEDAAVDGVTMGMIYAKHLHEECEKQLNNSPPGAEDYCALPRGMRYVLELRNGKGTFDDWIYIARSNFVDGHLGLFAAREFECGTPIGVYVGRMLHRYCVGGKNPSQQRLNDDLNKTNVKFEPYTMVVRDKDCRLRIVEADPLPKWQRSVKLGEEEELERVPMFMGMHFANDCLLPYRKDSKLAGKCRRDINIVTEEDGVIITKKRIRLNEECYLSYEDDWRIGKPKGGELDSEEEEEDEGDIERKRAKRKKAVGSLGGKKKAAVSSSNRGRR